MQMYQIYHYYILLFLSQLLRIWGHSGGGWYGTVRGPCWQWQWGEICLVYGRLFPSHKIMVSHLSPRVCNMIVLHLEWLYDSLFCAVLAHIWWVINWTPLKHYWLILMYLYHWTSHQLLCDYNWQLLSIYCQNSVRGQLENIISIRKETMLSGFFKKWKTGCHWELDLEPLAWLPVLWPLTYNH